METQPIKENDMRCENCVTETTYYKGKPSGYMTTTLCAEHQAEADAQNAAEAIMKPYRDADPVTIMKAVKAVSSDNLVALSPALGILIPSLMVKDWAEINDSLVKIIAQGGITQELADGLKSLLKTNFQIDLDNIPEGV